MFAGQDACVTPVLSMTEAPDHPHLAARGTFTETGAVTQPAPAPRFVPAVTGETVPPGELGRDTDAVLADIGLSDSDVAELRRAGVVG